MGNLCSHDNSQQPVFQSQSRQSMRPSFSYPQSSINQDLCDPISKKPYDLVTHVPHIVPCCGETYAITTLDKLKNSKNNNICPGCKAPLPVAGFVINKLVCNIIKKEKSMTPDTAVEVEVNNKMAPKKDILKEPNRQPQPQEEMKIGEVKKEDKKAPKLDIPKEANRQPQPQEERKAGEVKKEQDPSETPLLKAAREGEEMEFLRLMMNCTMSDLSAKDSQGNNIFHSVAIGGSMEIAKIMITQKFSTNANLRNNAGNTALHEASQHGHYEICSLLIKNGAKVNLPNKKRQTALDLAKDQATRDVISEAGGLPSKGAEKEAGTLLIEALKKQDFRTFLDLLSIGADPLSKDSDSNTILHLAALTGNKAFCQSLCKAIEEQKLNLHTKNRDGMIPADLAKDPEIKELMLQGFSSQQTRLGQALCRSAAEGNVDECLDLLSQGASLDARFNGGKTPLHLAVIYDKPEVCQVLISHGAYVNAVEDNGLTPLFISASKGLVELCKLLIKKKADINMRDPFMGWTPLFGAVEFGNEEIVSLLLENNANVDIPDMSGDTLLHLAAKKGCIGICQTLIAHKADLEMKNNDGKTPLDVAANDEVKQAMLGAMGEN